MVFMPPSPRPKERGNWDATVKTLKIEGLAAMTSRPPVVVAEFSSDSAPSGGAAQ